MIQNGKPFFDVFPTLKIEGALHDKLAQSEVERVSSTKQKDRLSVYLFSARLIVKEDIWDLEKEIKDQLFPRAALRVCVHERFGLSSQYTPENLMKTYRDSILTELKEYSYIEYNAFRTADITYPAEGELLLTLEDTVLNRSRESELLRVMEKILLERCGLSVKIGVSYKQALTGKYADDDELKIRMRVDEIRRHLKAGIRQNISRRLAWRARRKAPGRQEQQGHLAAKKAEAWQGRNRLLQMAL